MNRSRWPDTGRFRSPFQCSSWLWFFEHDARDGMPLAYTVAGQRELPRFMATIEGPPPSRARVLRTRRILGMLVLPLLVGCGGGAFGTSSDAGADVDQVEAAADVAQLEAGAVDVDAGAAGDGAAGDVDQVEAGHDAAGDALPDPCSVDASSAACGAELGALCCAEQAGPGCCIGWNGTRYTASEPCGGGNWSCSAGACTSTACSWGAACWFGVEGHTPDGGIVPEYTRDRLPVPMSRRGRHVARPRHPVTGRRLYLRASSPKQLAGYVDQVDRMREDLHAGAVSAEDVCRKLDRARGVTLERAARSYMEAGLAANTRRRVASALATHLATLAALQLLELDGPRLSRWIERMRARGLAAGTIAVQWRTLRAIVRHAAERGWIARSPWGAWRPTSRGGRPGADRLPREAARSPRELVQLLEAAHTLDRRQRSAVRGVGQLEAAIACAALLGLRQRELAGLRWSDVDAVAGEVAIVRQGREDPTKGRRVDVLQADPRLFEVLERHREVLRDLELYDPRGPVFPHRSTREPGSVSRDRGPVQPYPSRAEVLPTRALRTAVQLAGLPNVERWTPHSLRDSFVTLEAAGGADLATVALRSRHASAATALRYLRTLQRGPASPRPGFLLPGPEAPAPQLQAGGRRRRPFR